MQKLLFKRLVEQDEALAVSVRRAASRRRFAHRHQSQTRFDSSSAATDVPVIESTNVEEEIAELRKEIAAAAAVASASTDRQGKYEISQPRFILSPSQ